jgi:hypothetical protein
MNNIYYLYCYDRRQLVDVHTFPGIIPPFLFPYFTGICSPYSAELDDI